MKIGLITVAGISSRFNAGISPEQHELKCIYTEGGQKDTLLYHMLDRMSYADRVVVVGGYRYDELTAYIEELPASMKDRIETVYNEHFSDLGSGYSLYLGLERAFELWGDDLGEILFAEGDLDVDDESFSRIVDCPGPVLTCNHHTIRGDRSVILYTDSAGHYRYVYNSSHGLVSIDEPFAAVYNSGQIWKLTDMAVLRDSCKAFYDDAPDGTNLAIIQGYLDRTDCKDITLIPLSRWVNCNTRGDYADIRRNWEA